MTDVGVYRRMYSELANMLHSIDGNELGPYLHRSYFHRQERSAGATNRKSISGLKDMYY